MFYIVRAYEFEEVLHGDDVTVQSQNLNDSRVGQNYTLQKYGCKLVGTIPVNDAMGVDQILKKYEDAKAAKATKKGGDGGEPLLSKPNQLSELQDLSANRNPENLESPSH